MGKAGTPSTSGSRSGEGDDDGSPRRHYSISERSRGHLGLYRWALGEDTNDPALKVQIQFISRMFFAS